MNMAPLSSASADAIARLVAYDPPPSTFEAVPLSRRAAVLILLFADRRGDLRVVLTRRSQNLKSFPGQVSLPGGKTDSLSETPFDTARREAEEEIGLPREGSKIPAPFKVDHLCELPSNLAKSELVVRPCVALLHAGRKANTKGGDVEDNLIPSLDAREVAAVFSAPFHNFLLTKDEVPRRVGGSDSISGPGLWYQGYWTEFFGSRWRMHSFHVPIVGQKVTKPKPSVNERKVEAKPEQIAQDNVFTQDGFRVFGMTARILVDAARIAYGQEPEFEHNSHFGDEELIKQLMAAGRLQDKKRAKDDTLKEDSAKDAKI